VILALRLWKASRYRQQWQHLLDLILLALRSDYQVGLPCMKQPSNSQLTFLTAAALLVASFNCLAADGPPIAKQAGMGPVKVFVLAGQSNMEGPAVVDICPAAFVSLRSLPALTP